MFLQRLKQLAARLMGWRAPSSGPSQDPYAEVRESSGPSQDPYAGVREPRKRGPAGRHSAAAVMEPDPHQSVGAIGRWQRTQQ
jgi:hypothetical protein